MATTLNVYRQWLELRHERPKTHYHLLGLSMFTSDLVAIKKAANQARAKVEKHRGKEHDAEVERLRQLVAIASVEGVLVGLHTEAGRMTEDPSTTVVLCDNVKGLGVTLDPSHYIYGPQGRANYEQVMKHTHHVRLRDTTKDQLQVRVGQGEVEYGKLVAQLGKYRYNHALCVDIHPTPDVDQLAELRKMRLLLESLL